MSGKFSRFAAVVMVFRMRLASSFASTAFNADLQGQSFGITNWMSSNVTGWRELDFIPTRVFLSGGPVTGQVIMVNFDHTKTSGTSGGTVTPGIQNLSQFVASSNVTITAGPTLASFSGDVWTYSFTVNLNDTNPGFVEFRSRVAAGAHNFTGNSLGLGGSPSLGTLQIAKPGVSPGDPDLAITKMGPSSANAGATITYNLTYTNRAGSAATGTQITDVLPGVVSLQSCSGGCSVVGNTVIWDLGNLARGAGGSLTYQVVLSRSEERRV